MTLEEFKKDFKERFLNFETAKGIYMVPAGVIIVYASIFHVSFVIQTAFALGGWYCASEGLRKIFVNRIKQALAKEQLKQTHLSDSGEPTVIPKVPAPEANV